MENQRDKLDARSSCCSSMAEEMNYRQVSSSFIPLALIRHCFVTACWKLLQRREALQSSDLIIKLVAWSTPGDTMVLGGLTFWPGGSACFLSRSIYRCKWNIWEDFAQSTKKGTLMVLIQIIYLSPLPSELYKIQLSF